MSDNIVPFDQNNSSNSPFDRIRRIDARGVEFWSARELMTLLDFAKWDKFKGSIDIAQENLEASDVDASIHFFPVEVKTNGRPAIDYKLTRLGCYHVVLSCDSRGKPTVKQAKHYFAVKTREAEVVIPLQDNRIRLLELENENLRLKHLMLDRADLLKITAPALAEAIICPGVQVVEKAEFVDRTVMIDSHGRVLSQLDGVGITQIQKQFGFKSTASAWKWLESIGYGKESGYWEKEMVAHETPKLKRSELAVLRQKFAAHNGDRQRLLGE